MKKVRFRFFLISATLAGAFLTPDLKACSCAGPMGSLSDILAESYCKAEAVFVGVVTDVQMSPLQRPPRIAPPGTDRRGRRQAGTPLRVEPEPVQASFADRVKATFVVEEAWRGLSGTEVAVWTGTGDADCGYKFKVGERYLVYAFRDRESNRLRTTICNRTRLVSDAGADLSYIRSLPQYGPGGRIYGSVYKRGDDPADPWKQSPMTEVPVVVESGDQYREIWTDYQGKYDFQGLEPGNYRVRSLTPPGFRADEYAVELQDRFQCAERFILAIPDR